MLFRIFIFYIFLGILTPHSQANTIDLSKIGNFRNITPSTEIFFVNKKQIFGQSQLPYLPYEPSSILRNGVITHVNTDNNIYSKFVIFNPTDKDLEFYLTMGYYTKYLHLYKQNLREESSVEYINYTTSDYSKSLYGLIKVNPGDSIAIYAHFHFIKSNINRFKPFLIDQSFMPHWKSTLVVANNELSVFSYICSGILMMMVLYSFAVYYQQKIKEFLYYGLYALSMASMFFLKTYLLFDETPFIYLYEEYIDLNCMILGLIAYLAFFKFFINTSYDHPRLHTFLTISQYFLWIMLFVFSIVYFFTNNYSILHYIEHYLTKVVLLVIGLTLMVYGLLKKEVLLRYLAIGNGLLIFFSMISLLLLMFGFEIIPNRPTSIFNRSLFWYIVAVILELICFLAGLVYKNRMELITRVKEQEQLKRDNERKEFEKQMAVITATQQERDRISADMHDELGSGVTAIGLMTEIVKTKLNGNVFPELDKISNSASELLVKMNTIIWTMKSTNDSLESLIAYIRSHTVEFLENTPIQLEINTPSEIPVKIISGDKRGNIFLSVKEAINNIVKHSGANKVNIQIYFENDQLVIKIQDNGVGFDEKNTRRFGNGMTNMKKRMEQIGGEMSILNGNGSTIIFEIPISN